MTDINKQKFLAELGKLLTFMYEEDRQSALAMYAKLFDNARDEQSLLQFLVSPTRQAVLIARAYNARERKLQVSSQSRSSDYKEEGTPGYVSMIGKLESEAIEKKIITPEVSTDQFTLFADGVHPVEEGEASAPAAQAEAVSEETPAADTAAVPATEAVDESDTELEIVEPDSADEPELTPEADEEPEETPAEDAPENTPVEAEAESGDVSADADDADETATTDADALPISDDDEVDNFLADFSIADDLISDSDENESPAKEQPAQVPEASDTKSKPDLDWNIPVNPPSFVDSDQSEIFDMTERQPIIPLLILYIIIAIRSPAVHTDFADPGASHTGTCNLRGGPRLCGTVVCLRCVYDVLRYSGCARRIACGTGTWSAVPVAVCLVHRRCNRRTYQRHN